jgi:hypothetical protein
MRIRSTKPEFWRSKTIAAIPWEVRLVLKGLESYVDDNGVGKDDLALIAADVFPRDLAANPRDTLARLSEAISALSDAGLIVRYEVEDEDLVYIDRWKQQQRIDKPARGRFRRPDGTLEYSEDVNRESYASPRETVASPPEVLAPGTGEQGNRGTDLSCASADAEREFDEWYAEYPRKRAKGQAAKAYRSARKKASAETLLQRLREQRAAIVARGLDYCPYPATWLNGERWDDEPPGVVQLHRLGVQSDGSRIDENGVRYLPDGTVDESTLPPVEDSWMKRRPR